MPEAQPKTPDSPDSVNGAGCLMRLIWLGAGNLVLLLCALGVYRNRQGFFSLGDALFWAVVAGLAAVRYLDIRRFHGQTATGKPAAMTHWRRYVAILAVVALAIWGAAHGLARAAA